MCTSHDRHHQSHLLVVKLIVGLLPPSRNSLVRCWLTLEKPLSFPLRRQHPPFHADIVYKALYAIPHIPAHNFHLNLPLAESEWKREREVKNNCINHTLSQCFTKVDTLYSNLQLSIVMLIKWQSNSCIFHPFPLSWSSVFSQNAEASWPETFHWY